MSWDLSGYIDVKPLVADFVVKAGEWLAVIDDGNLLTFFVGIGLVLIAAAAFLIVDGWKALQAPRKEEAAEAA